VSTYKHISAIYFLSDVVQMTCSLSRHFIIIPQIDEKIVNTTSQNEQKGITTKKYSSKSDQWFSRYRLFKLLPPLAGALYPL